MGSDSKAFGSMMLFFLTVLSYTPLKMELVAIAENATLTNNGVIMLNTIFGLMWILLAVLWLGMAFYYSVK